MLLVSVKRSWNYTLFLSCQISYLRFDHSYPDKTELLLFLFLLTPPPPSSPASLVCSAYGRTTAQSGFNNAFLSSGYHGITDASCLQSFSCFQNGITAARWIALAVVSLISNCAHLSRLVLSCLRELLCHSIDCLFVSLFFLTEIGNNISFFKLSCSLDLVVEMIIVVAVLMIVLLLSQHAVVRRGIVFICSADVHLHDRRYSSAPGSSRSLPV